MMEEMAASGEECPLRDMTPEEFMGLKEEVIVNIYSRRNYCLVSLLFFLRFAVEKRALLLLKVPLTPVSNS